MIKQYFAFYKNILIILLLLLVGIYLAERLTQFKSYVLISIEGLSIETTIQAAAFLLFCSLFIVFLLMVALKMVFAMVRGVNVFSAQNRESKGQQELQKGLLALAEGRWELALRLLESSADKLQMPELAYLGAVKAAEALDQKEKTDELFQKAYQKLGQNEKQSHMSLNLAQINIQIERQQFERALATLLQLRKKHPENGYILTLIFQVYKELRDWQQLLLLIPKMKQLKIYTTEVLESEEQEIRHALIKEGAQSKIKEYQRDERIQILKDNWQDIRKEWRDEEMVITFVRQLMSLEDISGAQAVIEESLSRQWSDRLILMYSKIEDSDAASRLIKAESWLQKRPNNPNLLLTLGILAMQCQNWGKAREYLETSLRLEKIPQTLLAMGTLMSHTEDYQQSINYYRQGIELLNLTPSYPDSPLVTNQGFDVSMKSKVIPLKYR